MSQQEDLEHKLDQLTATSRSIHLHLQQQLGELKARETAMRAMEEKMKLAAQTAQFKVKLDVGGTHFATSKTTLLKFPDSYFSAMLTTDHWRPDEDGFYFIDRSPKHFEVILNYMRTSKLDLTDYTSKQREELFNELDYYQLEIPSFKFDCPSSILNDKMAPELIKMLPEGANRFELLHSSAQKGNGASAFDAAVKGHSPTLLLIQANTGYVFGAYVVDVWGSNGGWVKGNSETFLFTLGNGTTPPLKLLHSGLGNGIHISGCGAHLGSNGDLVAFCSHSCGFPQTYSKLAPGYSALVNANTLAGAPSWIPIQMEVFKQLK